MGRGTTLQRILYVEDDADVRAVATIALERVGGFTLEVCGSGREALERAPCFRPDLLLLDVMMPQLDGPATLEALRTLPATATTPVIFMTARAQSHDLAHYTRLGALGVIPKPFDAMSLAATVRALWERREPPG